MGRRDKPRPRTCSTLVNLRAENAFFAWKHSRAQHVRPLNRARSAGGPMISHCDPFGCLSAEQWSAGVPLSTGPMTFR